MRTLAKASLFAAATFAAAACNHDAKTKSDTHSAHVANADVNGDVFSCPMHPEITGKEGETCSKCGMKLVAGESSAKSVEYYMQVSMNPSTIEPNKEVIFSFTPKIKGKESEAVALDVEHEKKIHLILVSDDLSWFDHIHPEYQVDGSYVVAAKFPVPGKYKVFADYKPTGAGHVVDRIDVQVAGNAPAGKTFSESLSGTSGDYSFELQPVNGKLVSGQLMHIYGIVKKNGKEIDANTLGNYLGAKAHFVVISLNEKEYLHVHPNVGEGRFKLHATFNKPGIHRGWVQFNADGKLHTIDFTMDVAQGSGGTIKSGDDHHHHDHGDHSGD